MDQNIKQRRQQLKVAMDADRYVVQLSYKDRYDVVTERTVSPIRFIGEHSVMVLCLGREQVRRLTITKILKMALIPADDVMMPAPIQTDISPST